MICLSSEANNVICQIKRLLLNYDLQIARVKKEIELRDEIMNLSYGSISKRDNKNFVVAKVEKENYVVFLKRLVKQKKSLLNEISVVVNKYEGKYSDVFFKFFIQEQSVRDIAKELGITTKSVVYIVKSLEKDIIEYAQNKKKVGN